MTAIPSVSLSWFESVILLVMQTLTTVSCLWVLVFTCFTPPPESNNDPKELNNLLVPPRYVLRVSMAMIQCFLFNVVLAPEATTGSFIERYSIIVDNELHLHLPVSVANISNTLWIIFFLLGWRYLAIIAFGFIWCGSLPIYLALNQKRPRVNTFRDAIIFSNEQLSVRLYFLWLTGALIFELLDVALYIHGSTFSYNIYAGVMIGMLVLVFVTYTQTRDTLVGYMAMWFLGQIINRQGTFEGDDDAKGTFEKLLHVANVMWLVIYLTVTIDCALSALAARREGTQVRPIVA